MSPKINRLIVLLAVIFFAAPYVFAANIGNSTGHAWAEKLGYVSLGGGAATPDYGVTVAAASLSGYAWSEKTGWINFMNSDGPYYVVTKNGVGDLSGYAWSEKLGYISFDDGSANNYYQVTLESCGAGGEELPGAVIFKDSFILKGDLILKPGISGSGSGYCFSGYGWAEKGGYVNFDDAGSLYEVTTTYGGGSWTCGDKLIDYDSNNYDTVQIGSQCWMAENLMVLHNADGSEPDGTGDADTTPPAAYGDADGGHDDADANWEAKEGYLYNWQDAMNGATASGSQGICPDGWHVPSHYEWTDLERYICNAEGNGSCDTTFPKDEITTDYLGTNEGTELKAVDNVNGEAGDPNGDDGYGFTALLAGDRLVTGSFANRGSGAFFWSSSESGGNAWRRYLNSGETRVYRSSASEPLGFSVRCVKD